jgi:ribosome-interacting GTPase 1
MGILDRIKEVEEEIKRTQSNKATGAHLGRLKAKRAKLRSELLEGSKGAPGGGVSEGFDVKASGDARVCKTVDTHRGYGGATPPCKFPPLALTGRSTGIND